MSLRKSSKKQPRYKEVDVEEEQENVYKSMLTFKKVALSDKQKKLQETIKRNKIVLATGPAGTSKTFTACHTAINLLTQGLYHKVILTKPTEIVGDSGLGYLKGSMEEKVSVYLESFVSNFCEILDGKDIKMLFDTKTIEFKPVQFIRGSTFNDSIIIIDEFQSFDIKELMAIVTRLGRNSKMIFIGDINQSDINKKYVAVDIFREILEGIKDVETFEFERKDIVRDPLLIELTDRYEKMKSDGKIPQTK